MNLQYKEVHGLARPTTVRGKLEPFGATLLLQAKIHEESPMKNVEMSVDGDMLTIRVDLSKEFGPSSSGKTIIVASTEGNVSVPDREEKVGLNIYRKKQA